IQQGDALRYQGNRSGFVYDDFKIYHGHDYWFAWAFKLGAEWNVSNSGGHQDRVGLWDTHQTEATIGNPAGLIWCGDSPAGKELWLDVERMDGSGPAYLYNFPAAPGQWQRLIIHYRSGSAAQSPVFDAWTAAGSASFVKLSKSNDPYTEMPWIVTPPFGDPINNTNGQADYVKLEIYKWTTGFYGNIPNRTMWTSGLYGQEGANLYDNAVLAVARYAK
ncbi:MAG: hypothetical protein ABI687_09290, partial [Flavitalea sp.]